MVVYIRDMDNPPTTTAQSRVAVQQTWLALSACVHTINQPSMMP